MFTYFLDPPGRRGGIHSLITSVSLDARLEITNFLSVGLFTNCAAAPSHFPALLTLLLTLSDYLLIYGPISGCWSPHISLWRDKLIRPERWSPVPRLHRRGGASINDGPAAVHWSGRWRPLIGRGTNGSVCGFFLSASGCWREGLFEEDLAESNIIISVTEALMRLECTQEWKPRENTLNKYVCP